MVDRGEPWTSQKERGGDMKLLDCSGHEIAVVYEDSVMDRILKPVSAQIMTSVVEVSMMVDDPERQKFVMELDSAGGIPNLVTAACQEFLNRNYTAYLQTAHWKILRVRVLQQSNYVCSTCGVQEGLQIDHVNYERLGHENLTDLRAMCATHHKAKDEAPREEDKLAEKEQYVWLDCPKCGKGKTRFALGGEKPSAVQKCKSCGYKGLFAMEAVKKSCGYCGEPLDWMIVSGVWVPFNQGGERHRCQH